MNSALPFTALIAACALAGCKSSSPVQYVSPRITGRVLDQQSRQPIKNVKVRRVTPDQNLDDPPKGGEVLATAPAVRTGPDGTFVLASVSDLALFSRSGWYSVTISFQHRGYERYLTNYTLANAVDTPRGEPVVKAGDILLRPLAQ